MFGTLLDCEIIAKCKVYRSIFVMRATTILRLRRTQLVTPKSEPFVKIVITRLRRIGWTNTLHEAYRLRDFGHHTAAGYAACPQFPQNLVRDFKKTASKRFRFDAQADATSCRYVTEC